MVYTPVHIESIPPGLTSNFLCPSLSLSLCDSYGPSRWSEEILHAVWQGNFYYDLARVVKTLFCRRRGVLTKTVFPLVEVDACTIMRDPDGRSRGFAFLTFEDPESVNAVQAREHVLDGKTVG